MAQAPQAPSYEPLGARLAHEAASRPAADVRVEDLVAGLKAKGVKIARTRQVLASPLGASYCATALTAHGLAVALCEYPTADAAEKGRARSRAAFDGIVPGRTLLTHGGSLLTISAHQGPQLEAEARVTAQLFAQLLPRSKGE